MFLKFRDDTGKQKDKKKPSNDLLDLDFGNPQLQQQPPPPARTAASAPSVQLDPWGMPKQQPSHHQQITAANNDPWGGTSGGMPGGVNSAENTSNMRLQASSDPWSPVQQQPAHLPPAATGAIPRTSPGIGLDTSGKGSDLHKMPASMYYVAECL